jgi:hypothetical protein
MLTAAVVTWLGTTAAVFLCRLRTGDVGAWTAADSFVPAACGTLTAHEAAAV